jgi:hypothetical protein
MSNTKIIVITCVKDEAWMLERFLATCSQFADHIIISDESTGLDDSLEIYSKYPKVILHHNSGDPVRGDVRRQFVFREARKIRCDKRIIIAIDSDEILSANILESPEWHTVLNSKPGTLIHLQWVNLWKNYEHYRIDDPHLYGRYNRQIWVDDGISEIPAVGYQEMHMAYNPLHANKHIYLNDIVCLHYQSCNWQRMESKHTYYLMHERANIKKLTNLAIYRVYGHMTSNNIECRKTPKKWFDGWSKMGIDMTSCGVSNLTHFDISAIEMLNKYGSNFFAYQDIWRVNWSALFMEAKKEGRISKEYTFIKPGKFFMNRLFHFYMRVTIDNKLLRYIERKLFGKDFSYES